MQKKIITFSTLIVCAVLISGCSTLSDNQPVELESTDTEIVIMNNYQTRDRVEYVFNCIAKHGGKLDYVTQYACGCKIDKIAEKLSFEEYEAASTFTMLRSTPGENGSVFRDPKQSKELRTRLKEAEVYAEESCFVK